YRLTVTAEGATLAAGSEAGLRNGRATWTQLLDHATTDDDGRTTVPGVVVEDEPRHAWRGLMVDCARHFTPVAELEKLTDARARRRAESERLIDRLAPPGMSLLHRRRPDDRGWRVEIHGWPRLIEVGATRPRTLAGHHRSVENSGGEPQWTTEPHSGHYTQEELRALVRYGADRGVTLVPEIDLPGHMQAAVAAYPELGNLDQPVRVRETWGISEHVLAPTETAFRFVRDVLTQVVDIFPSEWIHIGGDECPTVEWRSS